MLKEYLFDEMINDMISDVVLARMEYSVNTINEKNKDK